MTTALFSFERVTLDGDERPRLDDVSFEIPDRGISAIAGPSGAGKSSLLRCCNRLEAPQAGTVSYRGEDIATLDPRAHRREVAMVFQRPVLFPGTVADNLRVADPQASDELIAGLLRRAALEDGFAAREAAALSGGEGQRVCLARALATSPRVLLMDEPTSSLDQETTGTLERLMLDLATSGVAVVLVTHGEDQIDRVADRVVRVDGGRITGEETLARSAAQAAADTGERDDGR